jgi:hypothetical protein
VCSQRSSRLCGRIGARFWLRLGYAQWEKVVNNR